jgi:predicted DNA-binding transcriptional regulator AlpA
MAAVATTGRLRTRKWVCNLLGGISARTVNRYVADGKLPAPVKFSERMSLWDEAAVLEAVGRLRGRQQ